SLQLRTEDGGTLVLRPESQLNVETFAYNGKQDGSEHISLALLSGGFRAITGMIGKLHKENYSIHTPNAIIAIRGTDHETVFVGRMLPGQTAVVEPGTYNHVISGATLLQSDQGKLLIKPNQTGFASLNGGSPIILDKPLPIFGYSKFKSGDKREHHDDVTNSSKDDNSNDNLSGSASGTDQSKLTQTETLANSSVDLNTLETDSSPALPGSGVVGAHMAAGLLTSGGAQVGVQGNKLFVEDGFPTSYSNDATGFNYLANDAPPIQSSTAMVDSAKVTWGVYAGGVAFDSTGNAIAINYHSFAYTSEGATAPTVVSSIGGTATFSSVVGSSTVTESGNISSNSGVTLNVGIDLSTATLSSYNLAVTDANSRNWTGTLNSPVNLSSFVNGAALAVTCSGACSGTASGGAAGMLIGQNAKGLISSFALGTTNGQAVAGAVVMSRP
ncbi:MAG: FecR domain-containing protein, partial [Gallionella sp.]